MVCADTNSWMAYLEGAGGPDVDQIEEALAGRFLVMAPVVLSELLSAPALSTEAEDFFLQIPLLTITGGYWHRAGKLRARLFHLGYKPKLADTLIAQSCLDHRVPLLTRDRDFRAFAKHAQLKLL